MTSDRAEGLHDGVKQADGALGDNDGQTAERERDRAAPTAQAVVDHADWHYRHVSTP